LHNQGPQSPQFPPFYDELRRLGFVEGQNLIVDSRGYAVRTEQFPAVAAELVKAQVDAILAGGAAAARAAQAATSTIPILSLTDDMVGQGLVASLARPGGNITGISILATELDGKRQEILMEMVPAARRMAVLADANTAAPQNMRTLQEAAGVRGVELAVRLVERPERIVPEIEEARRAGAEALNVLASPILYARRLDIFERTAALRLPAMYQSPEFAEEGGLIGYGPRITLMFRQLARQLAKVFSGEKASDVPVEQPTTFELAINLQAAKGIGFEVPPSLVLRADKVIEWCEGRFKTKLPRRNFLHLAASAAALPAVLRVAFAQAYPSRPVRLIVGAPAGGGFDIVARLMGQWLSERLGQSFVIENRPCAGGNLAVKAALKAAPDGYTLLMIGSNNAWNVTLYDNLSFEFVRDTAPVASVVRGVAVLVVHPSFPAKSVPDLIAYAKANPGKINMGSGGVGSLQHVYGELFKMMTGVDMLHVPYRGDVLAEIT